MKGEERLTELKGRLVKDSHNSSKLPSSDGLGCKRSSQHLASDPIRQPTNHCILLYFESGGRYMTEHVRPSWDDYYINISWVVSSRSSCLRRLVGALIVIDHRVISTGYNGTPFGVKNCNEGGCPRCASDIPRREGYDWCFCVHAEQNALMLAARQGTATNHASLYITLRPCFGCLKEVIQAGIREVVYDQTFDYSNELEMAYQRLLVESGLIMRQHPYSM